MVAAANHFIIFASAAIVTGLVSFLLHAESFRGVNIVYHEVIVSSNHFGIARSG